ncbi:MAG: response regulator [Verrucomicrobiota bacterium]
MRFRFANAVRQRRSELGITQEELAWRAGIHRTYLATIESGARNPSLSSIGKLARALDVSLASLFEEAERASDSRVPAKPSAIRSQVVDILLVEDDPRDIELTLQALTKARLTNRVHVAKNGAAALQYLFPSRAHESSVAGRPHLILLDLGLPKVNGVEVLQRIRSHSRTRPIPVIVMTVSRDQRDLAECQRLGVTQFILKPVDFQNLSKITPTLNFSWALLKETGLRAS